MKTPTNRLLRKLLLLEMTVDAFHTFLLIVLLGGAVSAHYYLSAVGYFK